MLYTRRMRGVDTVEIGLMNMNRGLFLVLAISLAFLLMDIEGGQPSGTREDHSRWMKRSSSAIAITPDGGTLLVVNPDSNSISLVDLSRETVKAEVTVGVDPRTVTVDDVGRRAYVANRGSSSVSVVDLDTAAVVETVSVGARPYGVLVNPAGRWLYVAEQGADQLRVLDTQTLATMDLVPLTDRPSGLAISNDGCKLYITHLLTNTVTVLDLCVFPVHLPLVRRGPASRSASNAAPRPADGNPAGISWPLRTLIALWPDSNLVQAIVLSPDGRRAYIPHTRSNTSNRALTFDTTVFPLVSLLDLVEQRHLVGHQVDLGTLDPVGVGLPFDAALAYDRTELWVVNAASNDISVIDLSTHRLVAHIEVGDSPRGIVLSPDGRHAYVNNTLAGTVSIVDTVTYAVTAILTVTEIPLPPVLLNGKRLFHTSDDPRLSHAQWISCNTCHFDGEHDGRTWYFGFSGPRNTTSLLGMIETYPLRWSGEWDESADTEFAIRKENFGQGLLEGEMFCTVSPPDCVNQPPNQGRSYDLDCLAAYIDSLAVPLSAAHAHGEPLNASEQQGRALFHDSRLGCVSCHPPPLYTDLKKHDVGTATPDERIGPAYDTPSLRGLYDSAPYFHDGSAPTLYAALTRPSPGGEHDLSTLLAEEEMQDLIAFLMALPFEE